MNLSRQRTALLGHRGAVLWFTGLPAAGKSTLAAALEQQLLDNRVLAAVVDGDRLRSGLSRDLSFSEMDRRENARRGAELALALAEAGAIAVVAMISPFRADRAAALARIRAQQIPVAEIFINAPLVVCERRDPKQLYRKARAGELRDLTGLDGAYEAPERCELELRTDLETVPQCVEKLTALAMGLVRADC